MDFCTGKESVTYDHLTFFHLFTFDVKCNKMLILFHSDDFTLLVPCFIIIVIYKLKRNVLICFNTQETSTAPTWDNQQTSWLPQNQQNEWRTGSNSRRGNDGFTIWGPGNSKLNFVRNQEII